ncbi:hypothetical protein BXZ70DRAFT_961963 [Cristinia sonorae]|uniref:Transmembrane protein n=1 Tax=Cristinia sonorae TaxID=1940300 RepID=A0A8K0XK07_9AGAR|nr:hypothetical protein BXZ70DRAFT_961963 [Cristinia sonorae]
MFSIPLTLLLLSFGSLQQQHGVYAVQGNESCSQANQRLQLGTFQFTSDCDAMWYCNSTNICDWKGCRRDLYPFGYWPNVSIPERCPIGQFCPDEEDACQEVLPVGSACQKNRDDQCEGPVNWKELADHSGFGLNVNGSVCLNNVCMWANATAGSQCVIDNTVYIVYTAKTEYPVVTSRDNCQIGFYCDGSLKQCLARKELGAACSADKECTTFNCNKKGVCGATVDTPTHVGIYVYVIVGVCIIGGMISTLISLFFVHRRQRTAEQEKRLQYWREQNAFRQNLLQMQETAHHSLMSGPAGSQRNSLYSNGIGSDESQVPLTGKSTASGLRHQYASDDGMSDEGVLLHERKDMGRF